MKRRRKRTTTQLAKLTDEEMSREKQAGNLSVESRKESRQTANIRRAGGSGRKKEMTLAAM